MTSSLSGHRARSSLHQVAPRLAAARDAYIASEREWDREHLRLLSRKCELERLVGHRDLQVVRSEHKRASRENPRYMAYRLRKLERARIELAAVDRALDAHRRVPPGTYPVSWEVVPMRSLPVATRSREVAA
jgi:hypothetical protein